MQATGSVLTARSGSASRAGAACREESYHELAMVGYDYVLSYEHEDVTMSVGDGVEKGGAVPEAADHQGATKAAATRYSTTRETEIGQTGKR